MVDPGTAKTEPFDELVEHVWGTSTFARPSVLGSDFKSVISDRFVL